MIQKLGFVTVNTTDALALGTWWAQRTGGEVVQDNEGWFVVVQLPWPGPGLAFQKVEDPTPGRNRLHLDLVSDDLDAEVSALVAAGAATVAERSMGDFRWVTLADPDGNEFCVSGPH